MFQKVIETLRKQGYREAADILEPIGNDLVLRGKMPKELRKHRSEVVVSLPEEVLECDEQETLFFLRRYGVDLSEVSVLKERFPELNMRNLREIVVTDNLRSISGIRSETDLKLKELFSNPIQKVIETLVKDLAYRREELIKIQKIDGFEPVRLTDKELAFDRLQTEDFLKRQGFDTIRINALLRDFSPKTGYKFNMENLYRETRESNLYRVLGVGELTRLRLEKLFSWGRII